MDDQSRRADPPSAWRIETAMATWGAARARLLSDDPDLARDEAALSELLGPEEGDVESILARLLRGAVRAGGMAEAAKGMASDLMDRHDRYSRRAEEMRRTAFAILDATGRRKIELPDLTATIRAGVPALAPIDDAFLPEEYWRVSRVPDKGAIVSAIRAGRDVPGAFMANGLPSLAIRSR